MKETLVDVDWVAIPLDMNDDIELQFKSIFHIPIYKPKKKSLYSNSANFKSVIRTLTIVSLENTTKTT